MTQKKNSIQDILGKLQDNKKNILAFREDLHRGRVMSGLGTDVRLTEVHTRLKRAH